MSKVEWIAFHKKKKTVNMAWEAINCYICFVAQVHKRAKKKKTTEELKAS